MYFIVFLSLTVTLLWRIIGSHIKNYLYRRYTVSYEILNIGKARPDEERIAGTAVICGGSVAGLWAARICADHFEDVVIVEPEAWLATQDGMVPVYDRNGEELKATSRHSRTRLHQYFAGHVFWSLTLSALRRLFPNFDDQLLERDGRIGEASMLTYTCAGRFFRSSKPFLLDRYTTDMFVCSRDAYERLLRYLVINSSDRIRQVAATVTGLKMNGDNPSKIKSATLLLPSSAGGPGKHTEISAELVIDCTGGTQAGLKWIKKLHTKSEYGVESDAWSDLVISYDIHSRWRAYDFHVPTELRALLPIPGGYESCRWLYSFVPLLGRETKYFVVYRVEGHRIRFSFYGWGDPPLPESSQSIREYMETINAKEPVPQWIFEMLHQLLKANKTGNVFNGKLPGMNWIHYEKAPWVPTNFVAIGDAVMKVNPTFGQGCTKACIGAVVLDSILRSPRHVESREIGRRFSSEFFRTHCEKIADAWDGTKPLDYMFPTTTPVRGEKLDDEKLRGSLALLLLELAIEDLEIDALLVRVRQFLAPVSDLFAPWVLWRLLKFGLRKNFRNMLV